MAGIINNLNNSIPAKARVTILLTLIVVIGIMFYFLTSSMGGNEEAVNAGVAKVEAPPSKEDIQKDSPLDKPLFGENSEVGKVYKKDEQQSTETAKATANTSHLDALRVKIEEEAKAKEAAKPQTPPANSSLQNLLAQRKAEQEKAVQEQNSRQAMQQNQVAIAQNPWQQFIMEERKFAKDYAIAYGLEIEKMKGEHKKVARSAHETAGSETSASGANSGGSAGGSNQPAYGSLGYQQLMNGGQPANSSVVQAGSPGTAPAIENREVAEIGGESAEVASYDYPSERLAAQNKGKDAVPENIVVGETFYAMLQIGVNTDEISPIRAVVVENGKLKNAVLVGNPVRVGEKAVLTFDKMSVNGKSTTITAVALDPDTLRTGVADGVDRHTVERYSKLFLASFVEGFAEGMTGGQTTTNTDGSQSTIIDALPNPADQALVGLGKVGQRFAPIFEKEFERPPTITVEPNKTIILMFLEDIDLNKKN